jgi:hypothetical protein
MNTNIPQQLNGFPNDQVSTGRSYSVVLSKGKVSMVICLHIFHD